MTTELVNLFERLRSLKGPDRRIDIELAMLAGYRREVDDKERRVLWFDPKGKDPVRIPPYTASLDHAREFAEFVRPGHVGGCSWDGKSGHARIDPDQYFSAPSPEIALCLAALHILITKGNYKK